MEGEEKRGRDMPMELVMEILLRLPVKSLLRFACVSKTWLSLITNDRRFAVRHYLHKRASSKLMDNVDYVVLHSRYKRASPPSTIKDEVTKICVIELTEKKTFRMVKKLDIGPGLGVKTSNFCHGIMCIRVLPYCRRNHGVSMFLCNPAIGEVLQIPSFSKAVARFGIGFDSTRDDYKIIAISNNRGHNSSGNPWRGGVYSVRDGYWRSLGSDNMAILSQFKSFPYVGVLNGNDRILNLMGKSNYNDEKCFVSFDVVDEVFWKTPMPNCGCSMGSLHNLLPSSIWHACVCCFPSPPYPASCHKVLEYIDIWVLDGSESCHNPAWFKWVSVRFPDEEVVWKTLNVWMNDYQLLVNAGRRDGTNEPQVFHYDIRTQQLKPTGRTGVLTYPDGYVDSLVSIKGPMWKQSCKIKDSAEDDDTLDHRAPEQTNDCQHAHFIREVSRRRGVCWSYTFKFPEKISTKFCRELN